MAKEKKVEQITDMEVDFAQWYTDVCKKAELIDYSSIKGMFIYRPYGYAIWENIQKGLDERFKETGHENVYLPMLIPESLLQREKDHVEGFAPECAWVTYGGSDKLEERYCIAPPLRPCSVSTTPTSSTPGETCPSCTTSGAASSAGRRPAAPSCATGNSCGRRATPCTPPPRKPLPRRSRC